MIFLVDFVLNTKGKFKTLYTALVEAISVTDCHQKASELAKDIPRLQNENIQVLIEEL